MTAIEEEELRKKLVCKTCNGRGHFEAVGCSDCYGSGWLMKPDEALLLLSQQHEREIASVRASIAKSLLAHQVTMHAGKRGQYKPVHVVLVRHIESLRDDGRVQLQQQPKGDPQ